MTSSSPIKILEDNALLKEHFSTDEIARFCNYLSVESFDEGALLMRQGEPADSIIFILSGTSQVVDGDHQIALLNTGDFVGESMFFEEPTRNADVQALDSISIARFDIHNFKKFLHEEQDTALKIRELFRAVKQARDEQNFAQSYQDKKQYLALIAHNNMKYSLMEFCKLHTSKIEHFPLIATGTTGSLLYKETGMVLSKKVASGPLGGDQAVGTLISTNNIAGIIFFRDPLSAHPHHADIEALGRLCDVYQVPFATNPRSGEAILDYLLSGKGQESSIPNSVLEMYKKGQKAFSGQA